MLTQDKHSLITDLRAIVSGQVITPDDPEYDRARTVFYGDIDRKPAAIVRVAGAADVQAVVSVARDTGLPLAVRSGGHSNAGYGVCDGGIVIDLSRMKGLDIDPEARTAWAETGLTAREVTEAAAAYNLGIGFGDTGSVGIGGITLGGGVGYLVRKHGLTIDDLLAAEVVTADGRLLQVDANFHPDLFWAIRGGGGNFGVATRFKFRLHEVGTILGGMLMLPATPEVIHNFIAESDAAPEELSTIANIMPAPPMPFIPADQYGRLVIMAMLAYTGDLEAGERAVAPFRALATPIVDMIHPMPYPEMYPPDDEDYHPVALGHTMFIDTFDLATANLIVERLGSSTSEFSVAQVRALGGAMARVPSDATAFAHRQRRYMVNLAALYKQPEEAPAHRAWLESFATALQGDQEAGAYVNFLADEGEARRRQAYPGETWNRLAAIKAHYDPTNLFHINQNIPPAA